MGDKQNWYHDGEELNSEIKPFKHIVEAIPKEEILANRSNAYDFIDFNKEETLEEAYNRIYKSIDFTEFDFASFKLGAKWQEQSNDEFAIKFANWLRKEDTPENAEKWFHYSDEDMLNAFKEQQ